MGLDKLGTTVALIKNAASKKSGKKDIIKVDGDFYPDTDILGFVDPGATVNIIKDSVIVEKKTLALPEKLVGVIKCKNPRCITSTEQELPDIFKLTDRSSATYRCIYCESKGER